MKNDQSDGRFDCDRSLDGKLRRGTVVRLKTERDHRRGDGAVINRIDAVAAISAAVKLDAGLKLSLRELQELMAILRVEDCPSSEDECVALVMGEEDETGMSVPDRLKLKHPKLHAWLDNLLT